MYSGFLTCNFFSRSFYYSSLKISSNDWSIRRFKQRFSLILTKLFWKCFDVASIPTFHILYINFDIFNFLLPGTNFFHKFLAAEIRKEIPYQPAN